MLDLLWLRLTAILACVVRLRQARVLEHRLLRQRLAVLTRTTRTRPRARLRLLDTRRWVLARGCGAAWREPLSEDRHARDRGALASTGLAAGRAWDSPRPRRASPAQPSSGTSTDGSSPGPATLVAGWGTERRSGERLELGILASPHPLDRFGATAGVEPGVRRAGLDPSRVLDEHHLRSVLAA